MWEKNSGGNGYNTCRYRRAHSGLASGLGTAGQNHWRHLG
jgi:hypothetical protein